MNRILESLDAEIGEIAAIIQKTAQSLRMNACQGRLRVAKSHGSTQYYQVTDSCSPNGRYIRKKRRNIARALAQREYDVLMLYALHEKVHQLAAIRLQTAAVLPEAGLYTDLASQLQCAIPCTHLNLVPAVIESDAVFAARWLSAPFRQLDFRSEEKIYKTERGEKVRSKSEKIIADKLFQIGIPYRYEAALRLERCNREVYPDFTLLRLSDRTEVYLEYFGLMDNPEYAQKNIQKIELYAAEGYVPGKNAIFLFETTGVGFSTESLVTQLLQKIESVAAASGARMIMHLPFHFIKKTGIRLSNFTCTAETLTKLQKMR